MRLQFVFTAELWHWRGPSPFHFVTVPDEPSADIKEIASFITYGWGMIPATVRIGRSVWKTALFAKDSRYIVPIKDKIRFGEKLEVGDPVEVELTVTHGES